jgi:predicted ArsR family transcriptional regulator
MGTGTKPDGNRDVAVHRALSDGRRARIVEELRGARNGLGVQELAGRVGIHHNTVRWHLGVLGDAGVVDSHPVANDGPGRPRIVYELKRDPIDRGREEYRLLATVLAGTLSQVPDGPGRAESAGEAWGHYLVRSPLPLSRVTEEEAKVEVAAALDEQGFEPQVVGREIRMRRCPFHELAEAQPEIICAAHRGLIAGALAELGCALSVDRLEVFVEPDLCIAQLAPTG